MQSSTILGKTGLSLVLALALSGCVEGQLPNFSFGTKTADADAEISATDETVRLVERDVEAPQIFQVTDSGLWDGRPSLGGVWVAYPGDVEPERVIIRNEKNKKFVIGALFKRERENPGPKIQVSSDAAAALGILAGQPANLSVTALRRETVPETTAEKAPAKNKKKKKSIKDIAEGAIGKAEEKEIKTASLDPAATPAPRPKPSREVSALAKPYIQIGIFSVKNNATNTATSFRTQGVIPIVKEQTARGKKFWRVLIGPAQTSSERAALLKKAKELGFSDAYYVTN